ncbi:glycoside hydrolase family 3 protein [Nocardiopsis potens]|uniref:glycoside hydrolase family 3 protein n=1 Tax=Nocardiopsis potens TaxID=1246458 RepID=UPI00034740E0|nr:glycoside hydrolase family 3 protein [Nocardiopsis potens]
MPLRRLLAPLGAGLLLLSTACAQEGGGSSGGSGGAGAGEGPDAAATAEEAMAGMELEDKVGQLLVLTAAGTTAEENAEAIEAYRPGGFIYFPENLAEVDRVPEMSNGLQDLAADSGAGIPLFLGIDQEQGMVSRMESGVRFPDAMAVGATRDPDEARSLASATAAQLSAVGVNLDYAPVADVNTDPNNPVIGNRSFGSDPALVGEMAVAEAEAFQEGGVVPVVKHFPGHGDTDVDSHTGLPVIDKDRAAWEETDLPPFREAVEAGVDMIMTAHVVMPELDPSGEPATLSAEVIDGILRGELGYDGVVTTDALNMEGVRETHDDGEVAVRAVEAGADQLLMPPDPAAAFDAVKAAVEEGRISEERLDESVRRVLELKAERGLFGAEPVAADQAAEKVYDPEHTAAAARLADASVTLLRNGGGALPVGEGAAVAATGVGAEELGEALEKAGLKVVDAPAEADLVVVGTDGGRVDPEDRQAVAAAGSTPVAVVAQGTPYDAAELESDAYLAVYSAVEASRTAAARAIAGEVAPSGRLPVAVPGTDYGFGAGIGY